MQHLHLQLSSPHMPFTGRLFGQGVGLTADLGCTVKVLLCDQIGIASEYLAQRIQTIFLNGRPVDDEAGAVVTNGDVLALSAAMPGLVGTMLRKGGHLAAMRARLSHRRAATEAGRARGRFTLKLFNMIAGEVGPGLLHRGVIARVADVIEIIDGAALCRDRACRSMTLDGAPLDATRLGTLRGEILLTMGEDGH